MKPIARIIGKIVLLLENGQYKKEKNQLQSAFSKYVSPEVVDQIILHPEIHFVYNGQHRDLIHRASQPRATGFDG